MGIPLYAIHCFSLLLLIFSLCVFVSFFFFFNVCLGVFLFWIYHVWDSLCFLNVDGYLFSHVRNIYGYWVFKYFLTFFISLVAFWYPYNVMCPRSVRDCPHFFSFFFMLFYRLISAMFSSFSLNPSASFTLFLVPCRLYFANKGPSSQGYGFSSGHVWM